MSVNVKYHMFQLLNELVELSLTVVSKFEPLLLLCTCALRANLNKSHKMKLPSH